MKELDKKILAYIFGEKKLVLSLINSVTHEYFVTELQQIYKSFVFCFNKFKEIPTINILEDQTKDYWTEELTNEVKEILKIQYDEKEFPADLEKLKERYNANLILKFGQATFKDNWDGKTFQDLSKINSEIKRLSSNIDSVYGKKINQEGTLATTATDAWKKYLETKDSPDLARGIHLGFKEFDRITNGLQDGELLLIGGESGAGKSALSLQMGINAWLGENRIPEKYDDLKDMSLNNSGHNVMYFTLEMPFKNLRMRLDSSLAGAQFYGLRDGKLTEDEMQRFKTSLKFQTLYPKQFDIIDIPRGCTMAQIEGKYLDRLNCSYKPDLIIIDYISLMQADKDEGSDWLNLGRLAEQMHEFCRNYNVPVISPVQLNRPPKSNKGDDVANPDQHRVGRSAMLVQNANIFLAIKSRQNERLRQDMEVHIVKLRDGEQGAFVLNKRLDMFRLIDVADDWQPVDYNEDK